MLLEMLVSGQPLTKYAEVGHGNKPAGMGFACRLGWLLDRTMGVGAVIVSAVDLAPGPDCWCVGYKPAK